MVRLMRCRYCGTLQDEPQGVKICAQCGGELVFVTDDPWVQTGTGGASQSYVRAQLELDRITAPGDQIVERYLAITIETPEVIPAQERVTRASGREKMHFVAVLDTSGSMHGDKIRAAKEAVRLAMQRLCEGDVFSLVTFATDVRCSLASKPVHEGFRRVVTSALEEIQAGGQTALCGGLEAGINQVITYPQETNLVLLLSDGQANVGEVDIEAVGLRASQARSRGVTVSTLGVGYDYNEAMMAEIAIDGGGRFYHVADAGQIAAYLTGELGEMASLAAKDIALSLNLPAGADVSSLSAAYPVREHRVLVGDMPTATTLEIVVRLLLPSQPAGSRLSIDGVLCYVSPAGNEWTLPLNKVTVRYEKESRFIPVEGLVRPVMKRVLGQLQAASVLATSRAATRGADAARQQSEVNLAAIRQYAALLGEDKEIADVLDEGEQALREVAASATTFGVVSTGSAKAKAATHAAMRRQRGSKDFDKA